MSLSILSQLAALAAALGAATSLHHFELDGARRLTRRQADWLALAVLSSGAAFAMLGMAA